MVQKALMDLMVELVLICDAGGNVLTFSRSAKERLGYQDEDLPVSISVIFPLEADAWRRDSSPYMGGRLVVTDMYRRNQTCFPVEMRMSQLDEIRYLCIAVDLTKYRETERELLRAREDSTEALKYKGEFISNITHELRTPVNGMMGLTKSLLDTKLTPFQLETVNIIDRCCMNMAKIINDLLDFSKMESGKFSLEEKVFAVRDFLNKVMAFNVTLINEKGLKLILNVAQDIPALLTGDELRLTQILTNLINNAVKFTTVGYIVVEVTMTMEAEDQVELFFMVMDTGIGIAKEDMDKLFKSFSQVDASITRRFGGTGLGLSICRQLVEMMGGSIKVDSEEGKGSSFSFNVILRKAKEQYDYEEVSFPSGKFVYEGNGRFLGTSDERSRPKEWSMDMEDVYRFGTKENLEEIRKTMEKLMICIEMENWDKAENFAGIVKSLISDEHKELKRNAFRLELLVRKGDHDNALAQYELVEQKLADATAKDGIKKSAQTGAEYER